ncbi:MAG: ABC-F family ATP-binding cassette domain-containing protein [Prevotella ruminicola]|jgi:ATP-binding cassette subfamily F protein uup|uniref:ABC-F family ATP-binding cassette domain-containing protein n=1 Tax=Xylanibacter ruminicola TaxID=839 RepID=A0A9D5P062_XYLRU|nr:ABC-F family ATP-binding cassette domain-containing protein [Xylanibacter ruminicola]
MAKENPYLDVQHLTKSFGSLVLFRDLSFSIAEGQKVGLIAKNGTGKSTLLSILSGKEGYDEGDIIFRRDLRVGMLEQSPAFDPNESVLDACFRSNSVRSQGENHEGNPEKVLKAKQVLTQLKIRDLEQPMRQLSGGQQKRVALANVLITDPDLLILDEPTNHLDLEMIEWLEGYLNRGNKTLLMVTHDRFFLDRVCSVILELDDQTIYSYRGNYSYYLEKRQERIDNRRAEIARANNLYRTELEWMRRMPQARGHKARYREEAFYELEKVAKQRIEERQVRLKSRNVYIGSKIFECQYVSKAFERPDAEPLTILKDFYYNFSRFEKMGIVGNNGTGKSTFIKMLLGQVAPDSGKFDIGDTVRFGYFSQEGLHFDDTQKVIDVVKDIADYIDMGGGKHLTASQFLQHFMFTPEQQHNYVYKLSGGERRKLYLCTVLMKNPNFLVLDEPTNDLDIVTLQILEEYLQDFPGCVIVVSHDRYFMDKVVDHLLVFKGNGNIKDFPGNYTQYREWEKLQPDAPASTSARSGAGKDSREARSSSPASSSSSTAGDVASSGKRKLTYKEKRELEQLEKDIEALEAEKKQIEEALCGGTTSVEEITTMSKRLPVLNNELDEKSMRWLELSEVEN